MISKQMWLLNWGDNHAAFVGTDVNMLKYLPLTKWYSRKLSGGRV